MFNYLSSKLYKTLYGKFNNTSKKIYKLITKNIKKSDRVLEIGCSSGHISFKLAENNYKIFGIEIRKEEAQKAKANFKLINKEEVIYNDNILNHSEKYDFVWSSGLLQCLNDNEQLEIMQKVSQISPKALFIVPDIGKTKTPDMNMYIEPGVAGCIEYPVSLIPYRLSQYFQVVKIGKLKKEDINLEYNFIYYLCSNE